MAKWGSVDYRQIKKLQEKMAEFEEKELRDFCEAMAKEIAARLLAMVIDRTPVVSGDLRRAWKADNSSLSVRREGDEYVIEIINSMSYSSYVEYGHRQEPGRYVPALGKRLKKSWVNGRFMLTRSEVEMDSKMPKILEKKLERKLRELIDD